MHQPQQNAPLPKEASALSPTLSSGLWADESHPAGYLLILVLLSTPLNANLKLFPGASLLYYRAPISNQEQGLPVL